MQKTKLFPTKLLATVVLLLLLIAVAACATAPAGSTSDADSSADTDAAADTVGEGEALYKDQYHKININGDGETITIFRGGVTLDWDTDPVISEVESRTQHGYSILNRRLGRYRSVSQPRHEHG